MLKGYTAGLDAGPRNECWAGCWARPTSCGGDGGAGPVIWGEIATSSKKACFSFDFTLSIELAYIDCIFLPIHRLYFLFPVKHKFSVLCRFVTFQYMY